MNRSRTRTRARRSGLAVAIAALGLTALLGGCVAYPAYPGYPSYGYYGPGYGYPESYVAIGGGWGGWHDHDWHGGGGWRH